MSLNLGKARLHRLIVHRIGNRAREEGMSLSTCGTDISGEVAETIVRSYLLGAETSGAQYRFHHETDLVLNEVRTYAQQIFADESRFEEASRAIAKHLYSKSTHPSIPGGDLFVALFHIEACEHESGKILGVFKAELKERFLMVDQQAESLALTEQTGIDPRNLQKAALIFEHDDSVVAVERSSTKTRYWLDEFLKIAPVLSTKGAASFATRVTRHAAAELRDPSSQVAFKSSIAQLLDSEHAPRTSDVLQVVSDFIGEDRAAEMAGQIESSLGYPVNSEAIADRTQLRRSLSAMLRSTSIAHGIDLNFSKGVRPISVEVTPSEGGDMLTIVIKVKGAK